MDSVTSFSIFSAWRRAESEPSHSYLPLTGSWREDARFKIKQNLNDVLETSYQRVGEDVELVVATHAEIVEQLEGVLALLGGTVEEEIAQAGPLDGVVIRPGALQIDGLVNGENGEQMASKRRANGTRYTMAR